MRVYVVSINSEVQNEAYTSLKTTCKHYNLPYSSALNGKRSWDKGAVCLFEINVNKITGRDNNHKGKSNEHF